MAKVARITGRPLVDADGDGFTVTAPSGDEKIVLSIGRHHLLAFIERTKRMLDEADGAEVVELRGRH